MKAIKFIAEFILIGATFALLVFLAAASPCFQTTHFRLTQD